MQCEGYNGSKYIKENPQHYMCVLQKEEIFKINNLGFNSRKPEIKRYFKAKKKKKRKKGNTF